MHLQLEFYVSKGDVMKQRFLPLGILLLLSLVFVGCTSAPENTDDDEVVELAAEDGELAGGIDDFGAEEDTESELEEFGAQEEVAASELQEEIAEETIDEDFDETFEEMAQEPMPSPEPSTSEPLNQVTSIQYLANKNGGSIEIRTVNPAQFKVRPNPETNQFIIEIENANLAEALKRPYIMKDFEGSFGAINAYQNPGSSVARVVVQMKAAQQQPVVTQEGLSLLVLPPGADSGVAGVNTQVAKATTEASPAVSESTDNDSYDLKRAEETEQVLAARTLDEFLTGSGQFFGRPISIETNDADIRDVIKFIAEESGVNLVIADDVTGKVTVKLRQVPWDQALVIVMRSKGLGYVRQGNVLRITRLATLQAEATAAKDIVESQKRLTPLKVKVLPVSYGNVTDLQTQIKPFLSENRGQVVSDSRTSSLIVTDTADVLMRIERLVKELDIPPAQVMIEGKIVEASETFNRRVGVNWSLSGAPVEVSSSGGFNNSAINMRSALGVSPLAREQLQAQNAFLSLRVGTLDLLGSLDAALSLAQADNLVRIISSPRIVTMNKEKSEISQKSEVITIQATKDTGGNESTTAQRQPVELKLEVTPQITAEGSVVLDVSVLRQFAGAEVDGKTRARPINSRSAKTKVLVPNGQTAVIGGIYQSDESESESGVPGLKDMPVLGWLFKQKQQERIKNELLLFLTPRILNAKDQAVSE